MSSKNLGIDEALKSEYIQGVQQDYIPNGLKAPHPVGWKGRKQRRKRELTPKQLKAVELVMKGYSKAQAMREAGYSPATSNRSDLLFKSKPVQDYVTSLQKRFETLGIGEEFIALKFQEWLSAEKVKTSLTGPDRNVPDYDTQIRAYDRYEKLVRPERAKTPEVKRKLTIEEYITGEKQESIEEAV